MIQVEANVEPRARIWAGRLACPRCRVPLPEAESLRCPECGSEFTVRDGVPDLRLEPSSVADVEYLTGMRGRLRRRPTLYRWLVRLFSPVLVTGPDAAKRLGPVADEGGLVIDLGAGNDRRHARFVNLDRLPYPEVDVVVDAEAIPFGEATVDGVVSVALLEHVRNPESLLAELRRIIRPGGRLFLVVPFLQPFHAAPHDFRRWTVPGLCAELEESFVIDRSGVYCGPASSAAWLAAEGAALILSLGVRRLRSVLSLPLQVVCSPIKWLDVLLARWPGAESLASAVYVEATRRQSGRVEARSPD